MILSLTVSLGGKEYLRVENLVTTKIKIALIRYGHFRQTRKIKIQKQI